MKLMKFTNLLVMGLVLTVAASGCKKKPTGVTPLPNPYVKPVKDAGGSGPAPGGGGTVPADQGLGGKGTGGGGGGGGGVGGDGTGGHAQERGHEGWPADKAILKADTVFFDFDSSVVKASEKSKVTAVADYLKANGTHAVKVEGNCDERGTEEYNRALGERRALAVREELISLGIEPTRIDTISFGKDNPENDPGHDEAAWKKNRRDDFVVLTPPAK